MAQHETGWLRLTGHPDGIYAEAVWGAEHPGGDFVRVPCAQNTDYDGEPTTLAVKRLGVGVVTHAFAQHIRSGPAGGSLDSHTYIVRLTLIVDSTTCYRVSFFSRDKPEFEPMVVEGEELRSFYEDY